MKTKRVCCLLLLSALLASCGETAAAPSAGTEPSSPVIGETEAVTEEAYPDPGIEAVDGGGRDFVFLTRNTGETYCFPYDEIFNEGENGDVINDAVFRRNSMVGEKYNVNIVGVTDSGYSTLLQKAVKADDKLYDVAFPMIGVTFPLITGGYLYELSELPYVDVTKPWWIGGIIDSTSIAGKNFFYPGDVNLSALNTVGIVYFNKSLANELDITDIYDTVKNGGWTFDKLKEYAHNITNDVNGDGVYNGEDAFGLTCNNFVWQPLFFGTDSTMVEKDADDIPRLVWDTEKSINVLNGISGLLNDRSSTILVNQFPELQDAGGWGNASIRMFSENRALFWIEIIYGVPQLRDMGQDFGILPMPKYDGAQAHYTSYIHPGHASATVVPVTNDDLDLTGRILEDMSYQSYRLVRPEFYDKTLKTKQARDEESAEMLDIIYSNVKLDLALVIGLSIDQLVRTEVTNNSNNFVSAFSKQRNSIEKSLQKGIDAILAMGDAE